MTGTINRWTYSRRGFISSIPNSVLQYAFWHACMSKRTLQYQIFPMIMHDCSGHSTSQISTTELQRSPQFQLQQLRILSIAPSNADFRRSTHFLWVKTSFEFDKIPLTAERNDFWFFHFSIPAAGKYCSGENSSLHHNSQAVMRSATNLIFWLLES